ncbi:hypothetical protein [Actinoplanes sp. NPDC049802]|uniref:hypothetical protein n=1 Tax=Actinoplanes sp. NPDC049802 TaxID=3154742 RepID=UPI0034111368
MEEPLSADPIRDRLRGLACNPALPAETLLRLADDERVGPEYVTARRTWTDEAFDALAAHPCPAVREALAQSPGATGEQRARLVGDLDLDVLHALLEGPPARWSGPLPDWVHRRLAEHPERRVRDLLTFIPGTPRDVLTKLSRDPHPGIAEAARELLARRPAQQTTMGRDQAVAYASGDSDWNRARAAADPELPDDWVKRLTADPSPHVRLAVSVRPGLSEEQRAEADYPVRPVPDVPVPAWVVAAGPGELRDCARSAHYLLRRGAACHPELPTDLITSLAADDDPGVRLMLCAHQAGAPADLLLRTYLEAPGDLAAELLAHPAFPSAGLARFAGHPSARARALARLDPGAPAGLIERLSHDPDPAVRAFLADDPRLPPARIAELLHDPGIHGRAAANPGLPHAEMSRILTEAGL